MKRFCFLLLAVSFCVSVKAQTAAARISRAFRSFESDPQLKSAIASLYVIEAKSGRVVFAKNERTGLAPASTQKIITAATAYALLGPDFRYTTELGYSGLLDNGIIDGNIYLKGSGDPTLGSWRWKETGEEAVMKRMLGAIRNAGIRQYDFLLSETTGWEGETIPDGWIWQDVGNYYGAGAGQLNWRENQYDLFLRSGSRIGDPVKVVGTKPELYGYRLQSVARSAAKGTGDNAYIYFELEADGQKENGRTGFVRGTIPVEEARFTISGAMPSGRAQLLGTLKDSLSKAGIAAASGGASFSGRNSAPLTVLHREQSPPLDSIIYWFNRRSINLYGEALLRTMAFQIKGAAAPEEGTDRLRDFWKEQGIDRTELHIVDGSGLSPLNRVTTHAQVEILRYAQGQPWYRGFYLSLPEFNSMRMKSGTIRGVKGFTGYHQSKGGTEYIFSFLVNNYNGSSSALVQKMYKVLDELK